MDCFFRNHLFFHIAGMQLSAGIAIYSGEEYHFIWRGGGVENFLAGIRILSGGVVSGGCVRRGAY